MATRGGKTPIPETLSQAKERIAKGGADERTSEMSRTCLAKKREIITRLDSMEVEHDDVDDLAVLRQMAAQHLNLGVLPEDRWSKAQIPCAVNEVLKLNASPALIGTGSKARTFSRQALSGDGDDPSRRLDYTEGDKDETDDEFPTSKGDYSAETRAKIMAIIEQDKRDKAAADGKAPESPSTPMLTRGTEGRTSAGRQWRTSATVRETECEVFQGSKQPLVLSGRPFSWEAAMNFSTAWEFMSSAHPKPELRGAHFLTAVAATLGTYPRVMKHDAPGHGEIAGAIGNDDVAHEWLGDLGAIGEERRGSGRTVEQLQLSASTLRGLAGGSAAGTSPAHLVSYFSQLFRAGDTRQATKPFQPGNNASPGSSSGGDDAVTLQLPEEEILSRV
jgi:hypothetical protein